MESLGFGLSLNEAKENIKTISKSLEPQSILNNLKKLLKFLKSSAVKLCFVNTQGDYLPFYHLLVLDEEYLTSTFFTDECKVVANEILDVLTTDRNNFSWEGCFGNSHIAGIPVILKKVYKTNNQHLIKVYENPIDITFKEKWAEKTLTFVKSGRPKYKFPIMKENEAEYLYEWILRQSREVELGDEYLWTPVWEAMSIFRLRYNYVVSLCAINSCSLKFVTFEKIRKKGIPDTQHIVQPNYTSKIADKEKVYVTDIVKTDFIELSNGHTEIEFVLTMPGSKKKRNKFIKKKNLVKSVSKSFIMKSFENIYEFVNDDTRATLEMRNLTRNEMEMLVCFKYYTPTKVATSLIFDAPCNDLLIKIHLCLKEKKHFKLTASNGKKMQKDNKHSYTPDPEEEEYDSSEEILDEMFDDVLELLRIQGQKQTSSDNAMEADMDIYEYECENETFSASAHEKTGFINEKWIGTDIALRNPLSILEKMQSAAERSTSVSPEKSRPCTGRPWMPPERLWVSSVEGEIPEWDGKVQEGPLVAERLLASLFNTARKNVGEKEVQSYQAPRVIEPQTNSKEEKPNRKRKPIEDNSIALENYEAARTPEPHPKYTEIVPKMKTKLLEGLSVPLESDKAMRMMRLMGWNGGALGVRGNGLIEPINPILDLHKRVGLGHKMNETQTVKQNKAQKKLIKERIKSRKAKKLAKGKEKNKSANDIKGNETSTNVKNVTGINQDTGGLENKKKKIDSKTAAIIAMSDNGVNTISLKCSEFDTTCDAIHKVSETTPITLTEELLRTVEDEKLLDAESQPIAASKSDDAEFVHYKNETDSTNKTVRMEFLVAVLDLLQTEKSFTFLWFSKKDIKICELHIYSMTESFNERTEMNVADYRENVLLNAISEEMVAHSEMVLLIERDPFDRRVITIIKTTRGDNSAHLLIPQLEKFMYPPSHILLNHDHYDFAAVNKKVTAAHIIANRLLLYFVQSDYTEITCKFNFFMNNASRIYINSIVSLLNRQVTNIKLALGSTEYKIFKRIAANMEDFFLFVKYDKNNTRFSQIRLVKVSLNKRCEICQRAFSVNNTADNINSSEETASDMDTSESFDYNALNLNEEITKKSARTEIFESFSNETKEKLSVGNKEVTENDTQCMDDIDICAPFDDTIIKLNQEYKNTIENTAIFESSPKEMKNENTGIENNELIKNPVSYSMDIVEVYEPMDDTTNNLNKEYKNTSENIVTVESSLKGIEEKIGVENMELVNNPIQSIAVVEVYESFDNTTISLNEENVNTNKNIVIYESPSKDKIDIEYKNLVRNPVQSMDVLEVHESFNDTINSLNEVYKESPKYAKDVNDIENEGVNKNLVETVNHVLNENFTDKPSLSSLIFESMPKGSEDRNSIDNKNTFAENFEYTEELFENVHEDHNNEELNSTKPAINIHNLLYGDKILQENCDQNIIMNKSIYDRVNKYMEEDDKARSKFCETPKLDAGRLNVKVVNSTGHILSLVKKDTTKNNEDYQINHNQSLKSVQNIGTVIDVDNSIQNTMVNADFSDKIKNVLDNVQDNSNKNLNELKDLPFDNNANHISFNINSTRRDEETVNDYYSDFSKAEVLKSREVNEELEKMQSISKKRIVNTITFNDNVLHSDDKYKDVIDKTHDNPIDKPKDKEYDITKDSETYQNFEINNDLVCHPTPNQQKHNIETARPNNIGCVITLNNEEANKKTAITNNIDYSSTLKDEQYCENFNDEQFHTVDESKNKSNCNSNDINMEIKHQDKTVDSNETDSSHEIWPKKYAITLKHPQGEMNIDAEAYIQTIIYKAVETTHDTFLPSIECHGIKNGGIVYSCHNSKSFNWLQYQLSCYCYISEYKDDLNKTHVIEMRIKSFIKIDVNLVLRNIGLFYGIINTHSWNVIQERVIDKFCVITIEIDNDSLEFIRKEQFLLFIGFDRAEIRTVNH